MLPFPWPVGPAEEILLRLTVALTVAGEGYVLLRRRPLRLLAVLPLVGAAAFLAYLAAAIAVQIALFSLPRLAEYGQLAPDSLGRRLLAFVMLAGFPAFLATLLACTGIMLWRWPTGGPRTVSAEGEERGSR